jgi:hypothetical protein
MKRQRFGNSWPLVAAAVVLVLGAATLTATAGQRPFSDYISRQGNWCVVFDENDEVDCAASGYNETPCEISGAGPQSWFDPKTDVICNVDCYAILDRDVFGGALGTTVDGSVTETALPDGRAEVKVVVHAKNALIRAFTFDADGEIIPLFGHLSFEVFDGAEPTLGEAVVQVTFKNTAPGAPLPDWDQLLECPEPGQELEVVSIRARASGPLREGFGVPEGTPGRVEMTQIGLLRVSGIANPNSRVAFDAFPAEKIIIRRTGK